MAATQDAVLVASPDEDTRLSITSLLRDDWPVRVATTLEDARDSLDDSIGVLVVDGTFEASPEDLFTKRTDTDSTFQILWLGGPDGSVVDRADAILARASIDSELQRTVDRLQRRARYDRLLTRYYELARERGTTDGETATARSTEMELEVLKQELDELVAQLDDEDAFEIALGARRPADR